MWMGVARQAYYQNNWKAIDVSIEEDLILKEVLKIIRQVLRRFSPT